MTTEDSKPATEPRSKVETIAMTPAAIRQAKVIMERTEDFPKLPLRLYIEGKGCDGFYYGVNFDKAESDDLHFDFEGLDCIVDPRAFLFCKGSTIDWVDDERGRGFLVENPREKSFRGKFYKKSTWRSRLEAMDQGSKA